MQFACRLQSWSGQANEASQDGKPSQDSQSAHTPPARRTQPERSSQSQSAHAHPRGGEGVEPHTIPAADSIKAEDEEKRRIASVSGIVSARANPTPAHSRAGANRRRLARAAPGAAPGLRRGLHRDCTGGCAEGCTEGCARAASMAVEWRFKRQPSGS